MKLTIQPLTDAQIREFSGWQYGGPYVLYNMSAENEAERLAFFRDPANGYFAIVDEASTLLGFCNFGADAQVPGGDYSDDAIDVGIGIRPDLTGQGRGAAYTQAVLAFAQAHYPGQALRVTIAEFNRRAQRVCEKHGFEEVDKFERAVDKRPFLIMMKQNP